MRLKMDEIIATKLLAQTLRELGHTHMLDDRNEESDTLLDQQYHALVEEYGMQYIGDEIK